MPNISDLIFLTYSRYYLCLPTKLEMQIPSYVKQNMQQIIVYICKCNDTKIELAMVHFVVINISLMYAVKILLS